MSEDIYYFNWKKGENRKLSENFTTKELECKCTSPDCIHQTINKEQVEKLQKLRYQVGPLKVTSGYRCIAHNKAVGGSRTSQHTLGNATDVVPLRESLGRVLSLAEKLFKGVGYYPGKGFIHTDSRVGDKARWTSKK